METVKAVCLQRVVHLHHRRQMQARRFLGRQRRAEDAAGVADHEGDLLRLRLLGGHDQVALVLAILVVDDDDQLAGGEGGDGIFDAVEGHGRVSH